jgi:hypothetical protein
MWSWIVIGVLYAIVIAGFRVIGGIGSAMDAVREWGHASASGGRPRVSS